MLKNKKIKITVILVIVLAFVSTYAVMFFSVNAKFPQNKKQIYKVGQSFSVQGAQVTLLKSHWISNKEIKADAELTDYIEQLEKTSLSDERSLFLVDLKIKNPTKKDINLDLTAFHIESGSFSEQFDYLLSAYFNNSGVYLKLKSGEEKTVSMPIEISNLMFIYYDYQSIKSQKFYMVCSLYPEKIMCEVV